MSFSGVLAATFWTTASTLAEPVVAAAEAIVLCMLMNERSGELGGWIRDAKIYGLREEG